MKASCLNCSKDRRLPALLMDNLFRRLLRPPRKFVHKFIKEGQVVADLGCGPGFYSLPIAEAVGNRGRLYAVDFDPKAIEKISLKARKHGLTNIIETYTGSAANVSCIPDASVDFVLANGLLCCMLDHGGAVREIKRMLKPEGEAYISITRPWRRNDPRNVTREEWEGLLGIFRILKRGRGMIGCWAIVRPKLA